MHKIKIMIVLCFIGAMSAYAEESAEQSYSSPFRYEIESQIPCFFVGGYHVAVGVRYNKFRVRAEIQNSHNVDFGQFGIDDRDKNFNRSVDTLSSGILADYFLNNWFFATASVESRNWIVRNNDTSDKGHMRTVDAGLGLGVQFFPLRHFFFQFAGVANLRENQKISIEGRNYSISNVDFIPTIRAGIRF